MKKSDFAAPCRWEWIAAALLLTACGLLFAHPDIQETANHTWLFLEHVFSGELLDFYTDVLAHENELFYVNAAHYNIFLYGVFGLWMLPVYGIARLAGAVPCQLLLTLWAKALACLAAAACGVLTARIGRKIQGGGYKYSA